MFWALSLGCTRGLGEVFLLFGCNLLDKLCEIIASLCKPIYKPIFPVLIVAGVRISDFIPYIIAFPA